MRSSLSITFEYDSTQDPWVVSLLANTDEELEAALSTEVHPPIMPDDLADWVRLVLRGWIQPSLGCSTSDTLHDLFGRLC